MTRDSMYEILMNLPAFRGITYNKVSQIVEKAKFHFLRFDPGTTVVEAGEQCSYVKFIIKGAARITVSDPEGRFTVEQTLEAPTMIAPSFLFGLTTTYPGSAVADERLGCSIVQISKNDFIRLLAGDEILILNMMNMLSMSAQQTLQGIMAVSDGSAERRLALWIVTLTQHDATDIVVRTDLDILAGILGIGKPEFKELLISLKERGLIDYEPFMLSVKSRRDFRDMLS